MGGGETVLIAEARVATDRSSRYLVQLCRHVNLVARANPQMQAHVEWSDDSGVIRFGWGRCTLRAEPGVLTLRAEATDEASLHQLEQRVARRLEQVGRRDRLTVTWAAPQPGGEEPPTQPPGAAEDTRDTHMTDQPRRPDPSDDSWLRYDDESSTGIPHWVKVVGIIVALVALLVVIMLLVGGGHSPRRH
jgi:hypothetical protein